MIPVNVQASFYKNLSCIFKLIPLLEIDYECWWGVKPLISDREEGGGVEYVHLFYLWQQYKK